MVSIKPVRGCTPSPKVYLVRPYSDVREASTHSPIRQLLRKLVKQICVESMVLVYYGNMADLGSFLSVEVGPSTYVAPVEPALYRNFQTALEDHRLTDDDIYAHFGRSLLYGWYMTTGGWKIEVDATPYEKECFEKAESLAYFDTHLAVVFEQAFERFLGQFDSDKRFDMRPILFRCLEALVDDDYDTAIAAWKAVTSSWQRLGIKDVYPFNVRHAMAFGLPNTKEEQDKAIVDFVRSANAVHGKEPETEPGHWSDRLTSTLERMVKRSDEELQQHRKLHAEIEGCSLEELDERIAERDKKEKEKEAAQQRKWGKVGPPPSKKSKKERAGEEPQQVIERRVDSDLYKSVKEAREALATPPLLAFDVARGQARISGKVPTKLLTRRQRELLLLVRVEENVAYFSSDEHIPDWAALKEVMTALGGKWKTGSKHMAGGFHFDEDYDAAERVRVAIYSGEVVDPRQADFFPTPNAFADELAREVALWEGCKVLEPSAGRGAIALAVRRRCPGAIIECIECMPDNRAALLKEGFELIGEDFLEKEPEPIYDAVVMNPPFSHRMDIRHVEHAINFVKNTGGYLVSVMSAGVLYRQDKLAVGFRGLVESLGGEFIENPEGSFASSGTMVRTVTLVLKIGDANP